jgi:hypothetical protein
MVISERHAYQAMRKNHKEWGRWGASQRLTHATNPLVRNTRSMGGELISLRNVLLFRG